jgi:hypothetical protein
VRITPTILGVFANLNENTESQFDDSVTVHHALDMISRGRTLERAIRNIIGESRRDMIRSVYLEVAGTSELSESISNAAREKASDYLRI